MLPMELEEDLLGHVLRLGAVGEDAVGHRHHLAVLRHEEAIEGLHGSLRSITVALGVLGHCLCRLGYHMGKRTVRTPIVTGGGRPPGVDLRPGAVESLPVADLHGYDRSRGTAWRVGPAPPGWLSCRQTLPESARHPPAVGRRLASPPARRGSGGGGLPPLHDLCRPAGSTLRGAAGTPSTVRAWWRRGYRDPDVRASAVGAVDFERAADRDRALTHRAQAQVSGEVLVGIEADPIVHDLHHDGAAPRGEANVHVAGTGVHAGVSQGLLRDPVQHLLHLDGYPGLVPDRGPTGDSVPGPDRVDLPDEVRYEALGLQRVGAKLEDQRPHLGLG